MLTVPPSPPFVLALHCRDARVYSFGHTTAAIHEMSMSPLPPASAEDRCSVSKGMRGHRSNRLSQTTDEYAAPPPRSPPLPLPLLGICPFNFPAMIPLWMFPLAVAAGNTFVLKPSEKAPGATMLLASMSKEAGLPDGEKLRARANCLIRTLSQDIFIC